MKPNVLILIPARYASTRFPGKPLAILDHQTMIRRVYENCLGTGFETCVVTDDDRIEKHIKEFGGNVVRVDDEVVSGSERILLAYRRFFNDKNYDLIVNVQGDEPLLLFEDLITLVKFHLKSSFEITTIVKEYNGNKDDFQNPNKVKVAFTESRGQCLYFSRSTIPYDRDSIDEKWFLHIGVYSYLPEALLKFGSAPISYFENKEKLEQLRALELGLTVGAIKTDRELLGVDTPEDLEKLRRVLSGKLK